MNCIGKVIKQLRNMLNMSQRELAMDICTEKYVYLIEKGKRIPSTDILLAFGQKMGVDIFSYYPYLNCSFPIEMYDYLEQFDFYRRKTDYKNLMELSEQVSDMYDFPKKPWSYEIIINKLSYELFEDNNTTGVICEAKKILEEAKCEKINNEQLAGIGVLLSSALQMCGRFMEAKEVTWSAYLIVRNKKRQKSFKLWIKSVYLNIMTSEYYLGEYEKAIEYGKELVHYQNEMDAYERAHFAYCYLAFSYYKIGNEPEAIKWFIKGLHLIIAQERIIDASYIRRFPEFDILLQDKRIDKELANYFKINGFSATTSGTIVP